MAYAQDFELYLLKKDINKVVLLWDEFLRKDNLEAEEVFEVLRLFIKSPMKDRLGVMVEKGSALLGRFKNADENYHALRYLIDLQTSNTDFLRNAAIDALKGRYGSDPKFLDKMRLVGLRDHENFRGAISNFELLNHANEGSFVYHEGGWGTGEILDVSWLREEMMLEFENITGKKSFSFKSAFKTLTPLTRDHFLSRRFGNPDQLEEDAKKDPVGIIKLMLKDLGPKNSIEVKDELCELVIPEEDWGKWWQSARGKLKKDAEVSVPSSSKEPIVLLADAMTPQVRLEKTLRTSTSASDQIIALYNFMRDFPQDMEQEDVKNSVKEKLQELEGQLLNPGQRIEIAFLLEDLGQESQEFEMSGDSEMVVNVLSTISVMTLKKRFLSMVKKEQEGWFEVFSELLLTSLPSQLKDWIFQEMSTAKRPEELKESVAKILKGARSDPASFFWYFQKIAHNGHDLPWGDDASKKRFFETFLSTLSAIENDPQHKDVIKKMYNALLDQRFLLVRNLFEKASLKEIREFLLLASKSHTLTKQDKQTLASLAEVVYPELKSKDGDQEQFEVIWTTSAGLQKIQDRLQQIGEVEIVENAREIEEARALGDLKENSEYKYAQEKRARLQLEMKTLSQQVQKSRVITPEDIEAGVVSVGSIVTLEDSKGVQHTYTLLGPWDADPEKNILSFQALFAEAMLGKKEGEKVVFKDEEYVINKIESYL